jgi:hypothetical protein
VPHKIIAFVTWADGAPIPTPLVDVTASKPLNLVRRLFRASTVTHQLVSGRRFDEVIRLEPHRRAATAAG